MKKKIFAVIFAAIFVTMFSVVAFAATQVDTDTYNGAPVKIWQDNSGRYYVTDGNGNRMFAGTSGNYKTAAGKTYFIDKNAGDTPGSFTPAGPSTNPATDSRWANENGAWYCRENGNNVRNDWRELTWKNSKAWYYFGADGKMLSNAWLYWNGDWYYLTSSGAMATNKTIDGFYVDGTGRYIPKKSSLYCEACGEERGTGKYCQECGSEKNCGGNYCRYCGETDERNYCYTCGKKLSDPSARYCGKCGAKNKNLPLENRIYCGKCGKKLHK